MILCQKLYKSSLVTSIMLVLAYALQVHTEPSRPVKKVTIFIHGTLLPVLALLNPLQDSQKAPEQNWYVSSIKKIRKNPLLYEDSIILQEGLQEIPQTILDKYHQQALTPDQSKMGAYQAIGAYDAMHRFLDAQQANSGPDSSPIDYYTFGFLGLLSNAHRKETARELYTQLIALKNKYIQAGYQPEFTLVGFSHGGNIILYLAACEQQEKKQVSLSLALLWGTPLYQETAQLAAGPLFKNIINIYSLGDAVQNKDTFSTPTGKSDRRFSDFFALPPSHIIDLQIRTEWDNNTFGHLCFWCFNKYQTNFSWPVKKNQAVFDAINPLPLVIISPAIIQLLVRARPSRSPLSLKVVINRENENYTLSLAYLNWPGKLTETISINPPLQRAQDYALRTWKPYARSSELLLCTTSLFAFWRRKFF